MQFPRSRVEKDVPGRFVPDGGYNAWNRKKRTVPATTAMAVP
jgi:hypothetical protein